MEVSELAPCIHRVVLRYGFGESPDLPREMEKLPGMGVEWDPMRASYFLARETLAQAAVSRMSRWRRWLYGLMARTAVPATEFLRIPSGHVVELGVRVGV